MLSRTNFLESARLMIDYELEICLTLDQVEKIIGDKMDSEWQNFDYKEASQYMDTAPREEIVDLLALHYLGRSWPTYGEKVNMDEFMKNFYEAFYKAVDKERESV